MNPIDSVKHSLAVLEQSGFTLDTKKQEQIVQYLMLLAKWNKHYNLTAIETIEEMFFQHVMDSLSIVNYLNGSRIIDVGTGAGLPGIVLAIVRPDWQITLIDSNQKKTAFQQQVKIELALNNITVVTGRVENVDVNVDVNGSVQTIVSRAYASLGLFIKTTQHLAGKQSEQCRWIAMKGCCTQQELDEVMSPYCIEKRISLTVSGLSAKRELIVIKKMDMHEKPE